MVLKDLESSGGGEQLEVQSINYSNVLRSTYKEMHYSLLKENRNSPSNLYCLIFSLSKIDQIIRVFLKDKTKSRRAYGTMEVPGSIRDCLYVPDNCMCGCTRLCI